MKLRYLLMLTISAIVFTGCDGDGTSTSPSTDYTDFLADLFEEVPCIEDCGISSPTSMCTLVGNYAESSCTNDCTEDMAPNHELLEICTECLEDDNCDEVFIDDEDDSNDGNSSNDSNCNALMTTYAADSEAFGLMFFGVMFGTVEWDSAVCTASTESGQAFLDGGCQMCPDNAEACLDDGSNEDTCCDELTQDSIDGLTAMCASGGGM